MDISNNIVYDSEGKELFVFKGEEDIEIDEKIEAKINSMLGARGAICMDGKTKIKRSESIDYGPIKDISGNIVEEIPEKVFVRNSIFH
jgi:hypothetical protein